VFFVDRCFLSPYVYSSDGAADRTPMDSGGKHLAHDHGGAALREGRWGVRGCGGHYLLDLMRSVRGSFSTATVRCVVRDEALLQRRLAARFETDCDGGKAVRTTVGEGEWAAQLAVEQVMLALPVLLLVLLLLLTCWRWRTALRAAGGGGMV